MSCNCRDGEQVISNTTPGGNGLLPTAKIGDVPNGDYTNFESDGTSQAKGDATCFEDLTVAAEDTEVNGSNPPTKALFINDGQEIPGTSYALSFLSTQQGNLTLPDDPTFDTSADFTFECWLRPVVATQNNIEAFRKQNVFEIDFVGSNQLNLNVNGTGSSTASLEYNRGAWNHIAVVHSTTDGRVKLYINAVLATFVNGATNDNTNDFLFNRQETLFDVDYIAYWDKELSQSDLSLRYASGAGDQLAGNEVNLKGLWELNDGSGTTVVEKTGISSDGSITGGSEGGQWDWIGGHVGNTSSGSRGVIARFFSPDILNEVYFSRQIPHSWKEGSIIFPHIHWGTNSDAPSTDVVRWGLEVTIANITDKFPFTTTIYAEATLHGLDYEEFGHYVSNFPSIDMTGKRISGMIKGRLFRDAEHANDTYTGFAVFHEWDAHLEHDMLGSREEFTK